jgi:L-ascorbate metabolism protein UlaG (beta-lactamase superfamily)
MIKTVYIGHSGFLVELEDAYFLFDYYRGELPGLDTDRKLFIFASHAHLDHYQRKIFQFQEKMPETFYILSKDVKQDALKNGGLEERIRFVGPEKELETKGCRIRTLRSTDEGVAFLVQYQGRTFYHAGDLNAWYWEEEGEDYVNMMRRSYEREIQKIEGEFINAAFVPVDPRLEGQYAQGLDFFMRHTRTDRVFPMHFWEDYGIFDRLRQEPCTEEYRNRIMEIKEPGQEFLWGKI